MGVLNVRVGLSNMEGREEEEGEENGEPLSFSLSLFSLPLPLRRHPRKGIGMCTQCNGHSENKKETLPNPKLCTFQRKTTIG